MNSKESAVIVLVEKISDSLILTQRSSQLNDHPGEICFPGGRWELGDKDLWATALRELEEELGISSTRVSRIKKMQQEQTHKGIIIQPWFASIQTLQPYTANENEVAAVFRVSMHEASILSNYRDLAVNREGMSFTTCQFTASDFFVWGATARIMRQFAINKS